MSTRGERGPVTVVGAGPCGSLLSIYLARAGHDVVLYESRPDIRSAKISAGRSINLALATRGIVPLVEVGVIDRVDEITIPMKGRMIHAADSTELTLQPYGTRPDEVIHSVSRRDLNAILLDAAEATGRVRIEFGQRLTEVDLAESALTLTGPDGESHTESFDVLVGTDGANSVVRRSLCEVGSVENVAPLDHGYKELTLAAGEDGSFRLDPNALHIWPRGEFMLIALANPTGDFTVTLFAPNDGPEGFAGLSSAVDVRAFFAHEFPDFSAMIPDLDQQFLVNPTGHLATLRTTGWSHRDRVIVLGDAAHAIVPFHGQGMNLAMESARSLARHLNDCPDDTAAAFAAFERERKPNSDAIADMALDNYMEMRSGVVDPGYVIRRELALELERRHPDRWSPRYNMVMFSTMPYADVQARAACQAGILAELTSDTTSLESVDHDRAASLIAELDPLPELDPMARPDALSVN
jgi:kynurenine 3-monooxygenase